MNSILKKSLGLVLVLFLMVFCFSSVVKVRAIEQTVTYTITSTTAVSTSGTKPAGSSATFSQTYSTKCQMTKGHSMTLTLSGYEGMTIKGIVLSMKSNKSSGAGSFSMVAGSTTLASITDDPAFNDASWNGAWSQSYVDVTPTMSNNTHVVSESENVVITISTSANSLYCQSFTIVYENPNANNVDLQSVAASNVELHPGQTTNSTITFNPVDATNKNVSYAITAGNEYASVAPDGTITALAAGVATLTVTPADTNADPVTCSVTVTNYDAPAISAGDYIIYANDAEGNYQLSGITSNLGTGSVFTTFPNEETYPITVEQGLYVNTVAFKTEDNKYLSLTVNDSKLTISNDINADSTWFVTESEGEYFVKHFVTSRYLRFNYNKGNVRFACYTNTNLTAVSFHAIGEPDVAITTAPCKIYLGNTLTINKITNISTPSVVEWSSSNDAVAEVDNNGVLTPVGIGQTTVKVTIDGTESNSIVITVYPDPENVITCAQANAVANHTGAVETTETYKVAGTFTFVDSNNYTVTDDTGSITVFKSSHGLTSALNDKKVQVSGKIKKYNSTNEITSPVLVQLFTITIVLGNGQPNIVSEVTSGSLAEEPVTPVRDGYNFTGWKNGEDDWDFDNNIITQNTTITAQWVQQAATAHEDFQALDTKASLMVNYSSILGVSIFNENGFVKAASGKKDLPEDWTGTVGGTYASPYYQSFRTNDDYVLSPEFDFPYSFEVSFTYYLNNFGSSGNKSTKLRFLALDENGDTVDSYLTDNINVNETGSANTKTISVKMNGEDIKRIKIVFVKDGGGNVAFSTISANALSFNLDKEEGRNLVSLQFAGFITSALATRLAEEGTSVSYGMIYGFASSFGANDADDICALLSVGGANESDHTSLTSAGIRITTIALTGVNSSGTEAVNNDPDYYQFGVSINKFADAKLGNEIKAFAFVCIDGYYYAMGVKTYSVYSIAEAYMLGDTSSYREHVGVLKMLADNLN